MFHFVSSFKRSAVKIAKSGFTRDQVIQNILEGSQAIVSKIPRKWANIQSMHIKSTDSPSLPIYNCLPSSVLKLVGEGNKEEEEEEELAEPMDEEEEEGIYLDEDNDDEEEVEEEEVDEEEKKPQKKANLKLKNQQKIGGKLPIGENKKSAKKEQPEPTKKITNENPQLEKLKKPEEKKPSKEIKPEQPKANKKKLQTGEEKIEDKEIEGKKILKEAKKANPSTTEKVNQAKGVREKRKGKVSDTNDSPRKKKKAETSNVNTKASKIKVG